ncbi:hypothetical protein [Methylobacterium sp. WL7]|uniref:hypothetical protein n=1 Tax=Methylobacterium sp. WL7 TaxID=2603900 RepID=UPI0011CB3FFB|nr:hypothetical protein [Methylobacterium sp. WL7]TXN43870.1 hypothetical protein FV233_16835 [Methylobacterium sp. WL7]
MILRPSTKIRTTTGTTIRFGAARYIAHTEDGRGVVAWIKGQPVPLADNPPAIEAELTRLADEHAREAAARFGGPMEAWSGGDGKAGIRRALAELARREADEEVARLEAEIARLEGREPSLRSAEEPEGARSSS